MSQALWTVQGQGPWELMSYWGGGYRMDRPSRRAMQRRPGLGVGKQRRPELCVEGILWRECEVCTGVVTPR